MKLTLRIKRVYFDQILTGKKRREYRAATPWYAARLDQRPRWLALHYQRGTYCVCRIRWVKRRACPASLASAADGCGLEAGAPMYEIALADPREMTREEWHAFAT